MGDEWNGKKVLVVGLGDTGLSAIRFLSKRGARIAVTDSRAAPPGLAELRSAFPGVVSRLGPFDASTLADVDAIVASPGVALREPFLREAVARGIEVAGDMEAMLAVRNALDDAAIELPKELAPKSRLLRRPLEAGLERLRAALLAREGVRWN
jgi:UDP-N-acetylmuramoylalanine-D-glutamate ligase